MLRLGRIMLENNPNRNAYGFGVYGITELDKERTRNVFGSSTLLLEVQSGRMDGKSKMRKWYRQPKKIYSWRYTTDCQQAIFERRAELNFVGIDDLRKYAEDMARGDELVYQNSHMQVELLRCVA